jgi:hypothetical protein
MFDEPDTGNVNQGVNCLANPANPGCPTVPWGGVKALIESTSSRGAVIDYMRRVAPVYDQVADPANPGQFTQVARASVSYDDRRLVIVGCSDRVYRNIGRYGFALASTVERYFYDPTELLPVFANRQTGTSLSPTANFDVSAPTALPASRLGGLVIPPLNPNNQIVPLTDVPGVTFVAPINVQGSAPVTMNSAQQVTVFSPVMWSFGYATWWWYDAGSEYVVGIGRGTFGHGFRFNPVFGAWFSVNATNCNADSQATVTSASIHSSAVSANGGTIYPDGSGSWSMNLNLTDQPLSLYLQMAPANLWEGNLQVRIRKLLD